MRHATTAKDTFTAESTSGADHGDHFTLFAGEMVEKAPVILAFFAWETWSARDCLFWCLSVWDLASSKLKKIRLQRQSQSTLHSKI